MKNKVSVAAMAVMMSIAAGACTAADTSAAVRSTLQTIYNHSAAALEQKNAEAATSCLDPSARMTGPDGRSFTAGQAQDQLAAMFSDSKSVRASAKILKFTLGQTPSDATVLVERSANFVLVDPKSKEIHIKTVQQVSEKWHKFPDAWRIVRSITLTNATTVNGKPVRMQQK